MKKKVNESNWKEDRPYGLWFAWSEAYWLRLRNRELGTRSPKWFLGRLLERPVYPGFVLEEGSDKFVFPESSKVEEHHTFRTPRAFVEFTIIHGMENHPISVSARTLIPEQFKHKIKEVTVNDTRLICPQGISSSLPTVLSGRASRGSKLVP